MDIKKLDLKKQVVAGTVMAVMSGFVPPLANQARGGTATMGVDVELVTAITLTGTTTLDFGRIAIDAGATAGGNHTLSPLGVVNAANNTSVIVAGAPGSFNIANGSGAGSVLITAGAAVTYDGGNISIDRLTLGGTGMNVVATVAAGATAAGVFAGGGAATDVQVGGRMAFSGVPQLGAYTGQTISITINDVP